MESSAEHDSGAEPGALNIATVEVELCLNLKAIDGVCWVFVRGYVDGCVKVETRTGACMTLRDGIWMYIRISCTEVPPGSAAA